MEDVVVGSADLFGGAYAGNRVFLTGHTGFKGSWLALWFTMLGATVRGYALDPNTEPALWNLLGLTVQDGIEDIRGDIRDLDRLRSAMADFEPGIVFHLAAQPLVLTSYEDPLGTYATNVMGTAHVLEAARSVPSVRVVVVVTSDKCYENREQSGHAYAETDPMGGYDPYSSSKGAAELVTAAYRRSFFRTPDAARVATVRAGNVIGGGDWAENRLIPDAVRAVAAGQPVIVRNPDAVRPWQHVLDPLSGYLLLGSRLLAANGAGLAEAFNFGPPRESAVPVSQVMNLFTENWPGTSWVSPPQADAPHEAKFLMLDWTRAHEVLGWSPKWGLAEAVSRTAEWYEAVLGDTLAARELSETQIDRFTNDQCRGCA